MDFLILYISIGIGYFFGYLFKSLYCNDNALKNKLDVILLLSICVIVWPLSVILIIITAIFDSILDDTNEEDK